MDKHDSGIQVCPERKNVHIKTSIRKISVGKLINRQETNNLLLIGLQAVINPKVCAIGVQCSSSYRYDGVCIKHVGVQCSLLVFPASTSIPMKHHLPSDTSQSVSDADVEGSHDTSEYTLSQEDTSL